MEIMQTAADIAAEAHCEAMKACDRACRSTKSKR
jgi:hypothetical protein